MNFIARKRWNKVINAGRVNWWSSAKCERYYNENVCGRPVSGGSAGCRMALTERFPGRVFQRGVSIGCGVGGKERALMLDGIVERFDLWEISDARAAQGTAALSADGLSNRASYHIGNAFDRPAEPIYDLVHWDHSLHHMPDVRAALSWSREALVPGGAIIINDYVGPNRLQWTRADVQAANTLLDHIHEECGMDFPRVPYSNLLTWLRIRVKDPSEAPQSEEIAAACNDLLDGFRLRPIGGRLLNILGGVIVPACDDADPAIDALIATDRDSAREGHSHFAFGIWERPTA